MGDNGWMRTMDRGPVDGKGTVDGDNGWGTNEWMGDHG